MDKNDEIDKFRKEGIILSIPSFILTKESILLRNNTKLRLSEIVFVYVRDNKIKVNAGRWIAITIICTVFFLYEHLSNGYIDYDNLFLVPLFVVGFTYFVTLNCRKTELIIKTKSGKEHVLATIGDEEASFENVHRWCGIISATGVDWKS